MSLEGRTALVTGASRNLGRAVALAFAAAGANVVALGYRDRASTEATAEAARGHGVRALALTADIGDQEQVGAMAEQALAEFGKVDILVNNVGYRPQADTLKLSAKDWRRVFAVNLDGPFFCAQAVLPGMVQQRWGRIINVSGGAAYSGQAGEPHVSASKAGILGLTRALAKEFAKDNVLVNTVVPGFIHTEDSDYRTPGRDYEKIAQTMPLGRVVEPEEIAAFCVFLCSEAQQSITGQALHINGGTYFS